MPAVPRRGSLAVLDSGADAPRLSLQSQRIFRPSAGDGQGARSILVSLVRRANSGGETSRQRRRTTGHGRTDGLRREKREKDGIFWEGQVFSMDTISGVCASCRQPARWVVTAIAMCNASLSSELASALKENSFGLKDYQVIRETQLESVATVVLLEGDTITVSLSPRGFEVGSLIGFLFFFRISLTIVKTRSWTRRPRQSTRHSSSCWLPSVQLIISRANGLCSHDSKNSQPLVRTRGICPAEPAGCDK